MGLNVGSELRDFVHELNVSSHSQLCPTECFGLEVVQVCGSSSVLRVRFQGPLFFLECLSNCNPECDYVAYVECLVFQHTSRDLCRVLVLGIG